MPIIVVADHAHINGGQAKVAIESALGLAARGHAVTFFAAVGPADPRMGAAGIETILLDQVDVTTTNSLARFGVQWLWNQKAAAALGELLARHDPDETVVHVHAWAKALSPSIGPVLAGSRAPVVFTMHEYYLACPNGGFYDYPVSAACHRAPVSMACISHNCDSRGYARKLMRVGRHVLMRNTGMIDNLSAVITISRLQREVLAPHMPADTKWYDVGNPIDAEPLGHKDDAAHDAPLGGFVFVGRLSAEKGAGLFAEAARLSGQRAIFVGDGPQRAELEAAYPEAAFLGWHDPAGVKKQLRAARALVFPSVWYEGQPLTVLESLALGTPVIVSDICAGREAVADGVSGLWFRSGDPASLAAAMTRLADEDTARAMSRAAYDGFWADPLTLDRHLDRLERIYREVALRPARHETASRQPATSLQSAPLT
ncbi:glycosyltransferase involved in cell wall biosynthesis [Methylorubrum rhodinum]|uniref:Glycosyltransferase involved in cell wall biosynthesis n=1 Tax=Methylorubrum rhodinum TaxID=29428 RepID=A0A840ZRV5_9HYPH|nr:glycosyltransferase family 4 protein [Methylorubrum rhodinum]MBB5759591.1 glycosyltransferase involved in cell wall biosynthesis [Methylorubrum rhodinum]